MSKKVTIEITEDGWETKLEINGKTYIEKYERDSSGAKAIEGDFEDDNEELTEELIGSISGFSQYDIMLALYNHF